MRVVQLVNAERITNQFDVGQNIVRNRCTESRVIFGADSIEWTYIDDIDSKCAITWPEFVYQIY